MRRQLGKWALTGIGLALLIQNSVLAHFPFLVRNADNQAQLFFGEGLNDRTYKMPPSVAKAEIHLIDSRGQATKLATEAIEKDDFVGLIGNQALPKDQLLSSSITYGVYRGSKLQYTALCYGRLPSDAQSVTLPDDLALQAKLADTDAGISVLVSWEGKPLAGAEVSLLDARGEEAAEAQTSAEGLAAFTDEQIGDGWNAIRVGHKVAKEGKHGDTAYAGEMHYLTATFLTPAAQSVVKFADLPFAITSFGAATDGKALYVYGGHMGEAHSYSHEGQSDKLLKLDLQGDLSQWQELATGPRLQGTAMVAYGDELIIIGGFQARNKEGQSKSLHSLAEVRSFNTQSKAWSELPALPEARSSHDAALVGSTVYVVGGWAMSGDEDAQWHKTAWKMELAQTDRRWEPVPNPPFQRRALATIEHAGKLYAIGGMNQDGGPTKAGAVFDPQTQAWSPLPEIHGEKAMAGFGASGWSVDGKLLITSQEGQIEMLSGDAWKVVGQTKEARFFHRVLPVGGGKLVSIGGANMSVGKFTETEVITVGQ